MEYVGLTVPKRVAGIQDRALHHDRDLARLVSDL